MAEAQSGVFDNHPHLAEDFRNDLSILWDTPNEQRKEIAARLIQLKRARTSEVGRIRESLIEAIEGEQSEDLLRVLKVLDFFYKEWHPVRDTPEAVLTDLREHSLLPSEENDTERRSAEDFIRTFLSDVQLNNKRRMQERYANALLPSLGSCNAILDFRAVFDARFGESDSTILAKYKPHMIDWTPVFIVKIDVDTDDSIEFQCTPDELESLRDRLDAALIQFGAAQRHLDEIHMQKHTEIEGPD